MTIDTTLTPEDEAIIRRQLEMVRRTGACNMIDSTCVQRVAHEMDLYDLVNIIGDSPARRRGSAQYANLLFSHQHLDLTDEEQLAVDEYIQSTTDDYDDYADDDFPLYLEYDGLYGAPDYMVEQAAQEEERFEAEAFSEN